jgi:hypothetical protein
MSSYGLSPANMVQVLDQFSQILHEFDCGATFPITAVAVERNGRSLERFMAQGIEFASHGYRHIDHSQLSARELMTHLRRAQEVFAATDVPVTGFRSPYLHFNGDLLDAASEVGLAYVSNQPVLWDVLDGESFSPAALTSYERAIEFYMPWKADEQPSLPYLCGPLVEIPVSLPDDEMLVDRLGGDTTGLAQRAWCQILVETHRREELFTLQLHPERVGHCATALSSLLAQARTLDPPVWIACLNEIATWWGARSEATVDVGKISKGELCLRLEGPEGARMLVRNVEVKGPTRPWLNGYQRCETKTMILKTDIRPFVGVPAGTVPELIDYIRHQGYIVEASDSPQEYSVYLDRLAGLPDDKRALLMRIEQGDRPLVKLGRWPDNTCSALAITGDVDALTLWDYGLRYLGH